MALLIIVPEELREQANHLARAIGNEGDEKTFTAQWSKKDGFFSFTKYFRVCNFGEVPWKVEGFRKAPYLPQDMPPGIDRNRCLVALTAVMDGTIKFIEHDGNAVQTLTKLGYKLVEVKE